MWLKTASWVRIPPSPPNTDAALNRDVSKPAEANALRVFSWITLSRVASRRCIVLVGTVAGTRGEWPLEQEKYLHMTLKALEKLSDMKVRSAKPGQRTTSSPMVVASICWSRPTAESAGAMTTGFTTERARWRWASMALRRSVWVPGLRAKCAKQGLCSLLWSVGVLAHCW